MNDIRELHTRRLRKALEFIQEIRQKNITALDSEFESWKERVEQSLAVLFGKNHDYASMFWQLGFWLMRADIGGGIRWSKEDQEIFTKDLTRAENVLSDALEELPITERLTTEPTKLKTEHHQAPIVINIHNILSQTTTVDIKQLISSIDGLGLSQQNMELAKQHANDLAIEAKGQQRWPVLAKSLEALKGIGKTAYERIAVPLILEMLKKQMDIK